jgi:hypothetical protein
MFTPPDGFKKNTSGGRLRIIGKESDPHRACLLGMGSEKAGDSAGELVHPRENHPVGGARRHGTDAEAAMLPDAEVGFRIRG